MSTSARKSCSAYGVGWGRNGFLGTFKNAWGDFRAA